MFLVLGIDAATWTIISPNLDSLPNFRKLTQIGSSKELVLTEKPISPSIWCSMFSGKIPEEHGHQAFVSEGNLVKREDIAVKFIWDILHRKDKTVRVLNVPFVVPPYCFNADFKPIGFGLPTNEKEWQEELDKVTTMTKQFIMEKPDLLISVYTLLDRVQHFHWGEDCVLEWYQKVDTRLGELLFDSGFLEDQLNQLIVISDHGFCSFGEAKAQTLPEKTAEGTLKGDHHENAFLVTVNTDYDITKPQDVFNAIVQELG